MPAANTQAPVTREAATTTADQHRSSGGFKRAYKACEACRRTKSKCELNGDSTVCTRCVRERRECVFPLTRSNKRARHSDDSSIRRPSEQADAHAHARTQPRTSQSASAGDAAASVDAQTTHRDMLDGVQHTRPGDLHTDMVKTFVTSSSDAMGLLFQAAEQNDSDSDTDDGARNARETGPASAARRLGEDFSDAATSPWMSTEAQLPPQLTKETLALWNKHRFVVQGWFSAFEAISYIEFFLHHLAPLSPAAEFLSADHETHKRLVIHEPLLCCTILMIASRYLPAPGPAGATRSGFIHSRLWRHIEHLSQRILFGSEKYSSAKSRTLSSLHALLLIIEWHPRLLHFPPDNDGWDAGLAALLDDSAQPQDRKSEAARRWREDVFEPAKRSDRLSWMLVGLAITLAHELGVFDAIDYDVEPSAQTSLSDTKTRIRRLLYLYSHQLSLRLGCPNMFPQGDHVILPPQSATNSSRIDQPTKDRELLLSKWIEITKLLSTATHMFFPSKSATKTMLRSYRYVSLVEHFHPLLSKWRDDYEAASLSTIPSASKHILLMEYYYTRMYINSIAFQALVERASHTSLGDTWLEQDFLRKEYAQDARFIDDVRESSGHILRIAKALSDEDVLRHCPVRVSLRIVSASIFLLKTLSVGSREVDARASLEQLDGGIQALMNNDAGDIHLSNRYAELIARHVRRFKRSLMPRKSRRDSIDAQNSDQNGRSGEENSEQPVSSQATGQWQIPAGTAVNTVIGPTDISIPMDGGVFAAWDDWLSRPFNPMVAPFGIEPDQAAAGLASDSLDFLWDLPTLAE